MNRPCRRSELLRRVETAVLTVGVLWLAGAILAFLLSPER